MLNSASLSVVAVSVVLSSSKPGLATVPAKISMGIRPGTFPIKTFFGQAGCTTISARVGTTTPQSALLFVHPTNPSSSPVKLTVSRASVGAGGTFLGGLPATGTVLVTRSSAAGQVVQLSSDNSSVTVPASVTLGASEIGAGIATFTIGTPAVTSGVIAGPGTCAIITATFGSSQGRALLKVGF